VAIDVPGTDRSPVVLVTRALQALLVGLVAYELASFQVGELINVGIPLALAAVPAGLRSLGYRVHPVLGLLVVSSATLHVLGSLGLYQVLPWFDQLAHAVSASLVAGVGFALVDAVDRYHPVVEIPGRLRSVFLFVFTTAVGVLWEIAEFGLELAASASGGQSLLTQYGLGDVVLDLAFDSLGAVALALVGTEYFRTLTRVVGHNVDFGRDEEA
jgi:hypothetical protein